jgi:pimeloyl-ACP methyl ester carboxylesterase
MKNILLICLLIFSSEIWSDAVQIPYKYDKSLIQLNATHYTKNNSKSIALILHGTRGHQNLELIKSLANSFLENNIDSLTINLSYGIDNRENNFFPCNVEHEHFKSKSIDEVELWFKYLKSKGYQKIFLIGHSRGGLNIIQSFEELEASEKILVESVFLIAPISDQYTDLKKYHMVKNDINVDELLNESNDWLTIDFLNCPNGKVSKKSFLDYFKISDKQSGKNGSLLGNLSSTNIKVSVIVGSEDMITPNTYRRVEVLNKKNIELLVVDGAGHFFRDLYFDDLMEIITERTN